ncbi:hypothetical protein C8R31_102212 [Nitrosospira sp. Nsp2]|uniref:hypothetical protein n=1 Tax=Nitrosospira sp. Nsp2 TaxID=136548 RepID=UPI000D2FF164|nr:hypothetical protein [Nitrosospira sp. Nsp2]PTR16198.1 hypothetical protein C8R31_102212 [Nitrosospira sp. Nsp2]
MTPDELEKLHDQQQRQAAQAASSQKLPEHVDISDFADLSRQTMAAVMQGFGTVANEAGSWIDSLPLPLQLMTQPKLTVDLTLATLASDTPFGLSMASLCKLAGSGFIYLNLRDYDSDLRNGLKGHVAQQAKLEKILDSGSVYIGSAVRKGIFDAAISKHVERSPGYIRRSGSAAPRYEAYREEAAQVLRDVGNEYAKVADNDPHVQNAYFRGRRTTVEAVSWQYAYLRAVEGYLPYEINRQLMEAINSAPRSVEDLTKFMRLARIFHLNFTAPITASFGTTYNITPDEYKELIRLRTAPEDPVHRDPEYDEIIDQFLYCLFDRKSPLNARSVASLKLQLSADPGEIVFTDAMIDSLIDVLQRNRLKLRSAAEILRQLGAASYVDGKQAELEDLIRQYNAIESESLELIAREKKLAKVFTAGTSALAALPGPLAYFGLGVTMPWLAAAAAFGPVTALLANQFTPAIAESVIEKVKLPQKLDKMLYRVHKIIR